MEQIVAMLIVYPFAALLTVILTVVFVGKYNKRKGRKVERRVRYHTRTYDDGFGKYTVDVKDEEWVLVPIDKDKSKKEQLLRPGERMQPKMQ